MWDSLSFSFTPKASRRIWEYRKILRDAFDVNENESESCLFSKNVWIFLFLFDAERLLTTTPRWILNAVPTGILLWLFEHSTPPGPHPTIP
jgi:hypothetical protein